MQNVAEDMALSILQKYLTLSFLILAYTELVSIHFVQHSVHKTVTYNSCFVSYHWFFLAFRHQISSLAGWRFQPKRKSLIMTLDQTRACLLHVSDPTSNLQRISLASKYIQITFSQLQDRLHVCAHKALRTNH